MLHTFTSPLTTPIFNSLNRTIRRCQLSSSAGAAAVNSANSVSAALQQQIASGTIQQDPQQLDLALRLDNLHSKLAATDASSLSHEQLTVETELVHRSYISPLQKFAAYSRKAIQDTWTNRLRPTPLGLYVHGSVGVGKTHTMDLFFEVCEQTGATSKRRQRRAHFHEFMLDVHERIHALKKDHPLVDPIPPIALQIAKESQLLCFDEFQVTDIADAMIMKRLFSLLFDIGVVVVSTSNRPPDALYEGGLNRSQFLPFIEILKGRCEVVSMDEQHDYRKDTIIPEQPYSFFYPNGSTETSASLERIFQESAEGPGDEAGAVETVPVMMGRQVHVRRANAHCGWFTFNDLCHQPLGAADYISISKRFPVVIVEDVPQLGASYYNEARRFVTMIDAFYEAKCRLVIASRVPLKTLFVSFEAIVESTDGDEEIAIEKPTVLPVPVSIAGSSAGSSPIVKETAIQQQNGDEESWVSGEGGSSSSSSTTMIRTKDGDMEWSATGRIGVSLAQLSAVKDVVFSFKRAESRMIEMSGESWGRDTK